MRTAPMTKAAAAFLAGLALFVLAPMGGARAHPHAWIDLSVAVLFDGSGRVTGLRETWLFDDFYTAFVFDGAAKLRPTQAQLDALMNANMSKLKAHDYFTRIEANGARVGIGGVSELATRMQAGRIEMSFMLSLDQPVAPGADGFRYAVFDPTYYIEILHKEEKGAILLENAPAACRHQVTTPQPDSQTLAQAYSLDQTQSAGDGLGIHFAEWVFVRC